MIQQFSNNLPSERVKAFKLALQTPHMPNSNEI